MLCYIFLSLSISGSTVATLGYWAFLFKLAPEHGFELYFFAINTHGVTLLLILIDYLFFSGIKLKPVHSVIPLAHMDLPNL
ncbi:MAG: hypothetical protein EZS28_035416 [Streblomastix strix]|uniref:Uncharacterized protein n=1 Tax=Streblomastix strix TaxID=222440 RepID=A0A5J4UF59_9EUKA|nr:MAG: hypothetical protein EZS28_035416 [Streblomastix strix]